MLQKTLLTREIRRNVRSLSYISKMDRLKTKHALSKLLSRVIIRLFLITAVGVPHLGFAAQDDHSVLFATETLGIYLQPSDDSKSVGRVLVASELIVLEEKPGWLRVEVRAWSQEGAERVQYALPGKRIVVLALSRSVLDRLRPIDELHDKDTGIIWKNAAFEGWIKDEATTPNIDTIWKSAWDLFATRCTACHQRRIPHHYTANQWGSLIKIMGPRTGLPKEKQRLILKYLQNHAMDMVDHTNTKP